MDNLKRNRGKLTSATAKGNTESGKGDKKKGKKHQDSVRRFWLTIPNVETITERNVDSAQTLV